MVFAATIGTLITVGFAKLEQAQVGIFSVVVVFDHIQAGIDHAVAQQGKVLAQVVDQIGKGKGNAGQQGKKD